MRVDYYLLDQSAPQMVVQYTCRLLNKAYQAGLRTFVLVESPEQAAAIDQQLWVSSDTGFVPHALAGNKEANHLLTKICIGSTLGEATSFDFLINLNPALAIQGENFTRVAELVPSDDTHKSAARKRYASWRDKGAELNLHNIQLH